VSTILSFAFLFIFSLLEQMIFSKEDIDCQACHLFFREPISLAVFVSSYFLGFMISISVIRSITLRIAEFFGANSFKNFLLFSLMLILNYLLLVYWVRSIFSIKAALLMAFGGQNLSQIQFLNGLVLAAGIFWRGMIRGLSVMYPAGLWAWNTSPGDVVLIALINMSYLPSIIRFAISVVFVGSFLLKPLIMRPLSLVWARIVESEKPVFTLTFSAAAFLATTITEVMKHLSWSPG
jgi:hypothetical protein